MLELHTPVTLRAFHCIPVRSTNKIASITRRFGIRGRWQPNGCTGAGGINDSIRSHNQSHPPTIITINQPHQTTSATAHSSHITEVRHELHNSSYPDRP